MFSKFTGFPLLFFILILSFLLYSINSYSIDDPGSKFQFEYFALPSETTSGAILMIPQKALQNGTIFPLTLGNLSSGAAIILSQDMLERGAILPLTLNKSIDPIYPKNFSDNSIIVVPEKMLSGGIINIIKGNVSRGAAIILPQDALDEGAVLSFKKENAPKGLLLILTKKVLENRQIVHLPQGGGILPITDANVSQGAIIFLPSQIVEDRVIPLPQEEGTILPITDANITDGAIIMLSHNSLDQGGLFQTPEGIDIKSFLHGDNLLSMPERGPILKPPTGTYTEICDNGKDDDNDGKIDENCPSQPSTGTDTEICDNGKDDDNDGKIDENCPSQPSTGTSTNQVLINNLIDNTSSIGGITDKNYTDFYNVNKMFDNVTNINSAWSQHGQTSFDVILKQPLNKTVCTVELFVYDPKNTPYILNIQASTPKNITGTLNAPVIPIDTGCIKDLKGISMDFDGPDKFTTLTEFKLFQNKTSQPTTTKDLKEVDLVKYFNPILLPGNSFFVPKNALPLYLPNNSLIIKNSTEIPTPLPDNSIFIPNKGPISISNKSELEVKGNYGPPINLPNGSRIGVNGEILIPLSKVSLILKDRDSGAPIPLSEEGDSLLIGNQSDKSVIPPPGVSNVETGEPVIPPPGVSNETGEPVIPPPGVSNETGEPVIPPPGVSNETGEPVIPPPGGSNETGEPVIPSPNVSILIGNATGAPIPLPNKISILIGNATGAPIPLPYEVSLFLGKDIKIVNSNEGWFLILPNSLGTIILPKDGIEKIKNLSEGTIIIPKDGIEKIKNLSEGTIIIPKNPEKILPQGTTTTATIILPQGTAPTTTTTTTTNVTTLANEATPTTSNETTLTTTNMTTPTMKGFNIAVAGDWGCTTDTKETFKNIQNKDPELIIGAGDLSYDDDGQCWIQMAGPLSTKLKIAFGDHDYKEIENPQQIAFGDHDYIEKDRVPQQYLLNYFNLTKTYYSFNQQNAHFLIMDPYVNFGMKSKQFKFVQDDLLRASLDSNIDWIFVIEHTPLYTSPSSHQGNPSIRDNYHRLFDLYNVDLVMSGDNHNYQRTYPLKYNALEPSDPLVTNNNQSYYNDLEGQIYLITGLGGQKKYLLDGKEKYVVEQQDDDFGFLNLNILGNKLEGIFYSNDYPVNKSIKDKFFISKNN